MQFRFFHLVVMLYNKVLRLTLTVWLLEEIRFLWDLTVRHLWKLVIRTTDRFAILSSALWIHCYPQTDQMHCIIHLPMARRCQSFGFKTFQDNLALQLTNEIMVPKKAPISPQVPHEYIVTSEVEILTVKFLPKTECFCCAGKFDWPPLCLLDGRITVVNLYSFIHAKQVINWLMVVCTYNGTDCKGWTTDRWSFGCCFWPILDGATGFVSVIVVGLTTNVLVTHRLKSTPLRCFIHERVWPAMLEMRAELQCFLCKRKKHHRN